MIKYLILIFVFVSTLFPQSNSTYTRYGLGDLEYGFSARRLGMGELGTAVADQDFINSINPAGWHALNFTRIEFGFRYNANLVSSNNNSNFYSEANFSGFALAFPLSKENGIALSFGLLPFTFVDYNVNNTQTIPTSNETFTTEFSGRGGINKLYIGSSYKLPFDLVLGASFDYYFGNINYNSKTTFNRSDILPVEYNKKINPKGIGTTAGLISPDFSSFLGSNSISNLRIGASIFQIAELKGDSLFTTIYSTKTDTTFNGAAVLSIPVRINAGISFIYDENYNFALDFSTQDWSKYTLNGYQSANLRRMNKFAFGMEYRASRDKGWSNLIWRFGGGYEQTQYTFNGVGINQYSVSAGFSYPLAPQNTLDFGIQFATRGTKEANLLKENLIKFNIGISFGELWFTRENFY